MIELARNRGFALLWAGQFLTILADWSLRTMVLIWVYALTRSGVAVSVVGLAEALPLLLLSPVAGVFVDRWDRAHTMAGAALARVALLAPLLLVTNRAGLPVMLLVTVLANAASQFFMPAASAAVPVVVGPERAGQANSLLSLVNGGIGAIGPGAAALLYGRIGPHGTVLVLGALYVAAAPILLAVPAPRPADAGGARTSVATEMRDGLRYVRRSRLLVSLTLVAFVAMLGVGALSVLDVVFVTRALRLRSETVGVLLASSGVGELLGGVVMALLGAWAARRYHRLLGLAMAAYGLGLVVYALAPTLLAAAAVLFLVGAMLPPILVSFMTLIQLTTDDAYMGRVNSLVNTGLSVAIIASVAFGGVLTDVFGVRQVIGGGAILLVISGVLALRVIRSTPAPRMGTDTGTDTGAGTDTSAGTGAGADIGVANPIEGVPDPVATPVGPVR